MRQKSSHIYVYGEMQDYLTGSTLPDTEDERIRQGLAKLLVEQREFTKEELIPRQVITTTFANRTVTSKIDLIASLETLPLMLLRCAPGSLVSRERSAIAAARIYNADYQIPLAVVYNGRDAEILDSSTGKILGNGIKSIPSRSQLMQKWRPRTLRPPLKGEAKEREKRILNAFDLEQCCLPERA